MIARTYKIRDTDMDRLRELLREAEAEVDSLEEAGLEAAERQMSTRLKGLIDPPAQAPTLIFDRRSSRRSRFYAGGFVLLAAAVTLIMVQPTRDGLDEGVYVASKGGELSTVPCQAEWIQSDRSTPAVEAGSKTLAASEVLIQPQLATYLKLYCPLPAAFVHISYQKGEERVWLAKNGQVSAKESWIQAADSGAGELLDFQTAVGQELDIQVSEQPLPKEVFASEASRDAISPEAARSIVWRDSFLLRNR